MFTGNLYVFQRRREATPPPPPPPQASTQHGPGQAPAHQIIEDVVQPKPDPELVEGPAQHEEEYSIAGEDNSRAAVEASPDDPKPHGREGYPFRDPLEVSFVQSDSKIESIQRVQILAAEIMERYDTLVQLHKAVRSSLKDFKVALGEPETAELTACFSLVKSAAGRGSYIDIVQQEDQKWKVETDDNTWQQLEEQKKCAINHFNALLDKAHTFLNQKQEVVDIIQQKLDQMCVQCQYQVSLDQYNQVNNIPAEIEYLAEEIGRFLHDMDIAKCQLDERVAFGITTGLIMSISQQSYQQIHCRDALPVCSTTETPSETPVLLTTTASMLPSSPIGNGLTNLSQTQVHNGNDSQNQVHHSQVHGQLPYSVQFSCPPCAYDSETVTFIDPPEVLVFDSTGGTYRNSLHGITLTIPEGAVPDGRSIHIQVGVAMHGPFVWPKRGSIVSPIVGLCMVQPENDIIVLQKLIKIRIPHYVNCLGVEDCKHLTFLKANHKTDVVTINGKAKYHLKPFHVQQADDEHMQFEPECYFGTLYTRHFCYLCIEKEYTPECTAKTNFCLMGAMPDPPRKSFELYFCVSYMLDTCIQVRNCTIVSLIYM